MLLLCTIQYYHGNRNHCVLSNVATGQRGIKFRWFRRNCHPWISIVFTFSLQSFSGNLTKEKMSVKGEKAQGKGPRSNQRQEKKKRLSVLEPSLQKNVAAAFAHTEVQDTLAQSITNALIFVSLHIDGNCQHITNTHCKCHL